MPSSPPRSHQAARSVEIIAFAGRDGVSPVPRETLQDRVYAELRRSLIHGVFATGEVLRILDLAEKLNTSTMPVREALRRLVSENALEALPNRSVRVPPMTRERLDDLARARVMIEGQVTLLAMPHLTGTHFARLRFLTGQCEQAFGTSDPGVIRTATEMNNAFHFTIYREGGSAVLLPLIESLWLQSGPYLQTATVLHEERSDPAGTHFHWQLIDALERRDATAAVAALTADISRAFNLLSARLDAQEGMGASANG
jgi:DNA-binding GntR family transcriptional regulator